MRFWPVDHTYEANGSVLKTVRCERCPTEYVYRVERVASATVTVDVFPFQKDPRAMEKARQKAESDLAGALERAVDPVPCPVCGWYQTDMVPFARKELGGCMILAAVALGLIGCLLAPVTVIVALDIHELGLPLWALQTALIACFLGAVMLPVARVIRCANYDPDATDVKSRIHLGRALSESYTRSAHFPQPTPPSLPPRRQLTSEARPASRNMLNNGERSVRKQTRTNDPHDPEVQADPSSPSIAGTAVRLFVAMTLMLVGVAAIVGGIILCFAIKAGVVLFPPDGPEAGQEVAGNGLCKTVQQALLEAARGEVSKAALIGAAVAGMLFVVVAIALAGWRAAVGFGYVVLVAGIGMFVFGLIKLAEPSLRFFGPLGFFVAAAGGLIIGCGLAYAQEAQKTSSSKTDLVE